MFVIWGKKPVEAYLSVQKDALPRGTKLNVVGTTFGDIQKKAQDKGAQIKKFSSAEDPQWPAPMVHHQNICLTVRDFHWEIPWEESIYDIEERIKTHPKGCLGIYLHHVHDPQNMGSIFRSAVFFGVKFVFYPKNRQCPLTPAVLKVSSGAALGLNCVNIGNTFQTLKAMKEMGIWIVGTSVDKSAIPVKDLPKDRPYVLVLGNEEQGLSSSLLDQCDYKVSINPPETPFFIDSLNVGVAAGIILNNLV